VVPSPVSLRTMRQELLERTDLHGDDFCRALARASDEWLAGLNTHFDDASHVLTIRHNGQVAAQGNLETTSGRAAIETFFTHREQFHSAMITPQVSLVDPATRDRLADLQRYFMAHGYPDPAGAMHRAIIAVGQTIRAQATIMGYADSFALIGVVLLVAVLAVAMLRKGAAAGGAAH